MTGHDSITMHDGKVVQGKRLPFTTIQDDWNEYQLDDGSLVRVRLLLRNIIQTHSDDGAPGYVVEFTTLVNHQGPVPESTP